MNPEDITGINEQGWRVHVEGCTCDYNEVTRREWVAHTTPRQLRVITDRIVSRKDPQCSVHP